MFPVLLHSVTFHIYRGREFADSVKQLLRNVMVSVTMRRLNRARNHWSESPRSKLIASFTGNVILEN